MLKLLKNLWDVLSGEKRRRDAAHLILEHLDSMDDSGRPIRNMLASCGIRWTSPGLHQFMAGLEQQGYVTHQDRPWNGEPWSERGGAWTRVYGITPKGREHLGQVRQFAEPGW